MAGTPERFLWAADIMDIKATHKVLEIGCGAGLLAEQIALQLQAGEGHIIAVDKSAPMISKALKRNTRFVDDKVMELVTGDFASFKTSHSFDKIVAFNVNFFWKNPRKELSIIREILNKEGLLYIFHQPPYEIELSSAEAIKEKVQSFSFSIVDAKIKKMKPASALCLIFKAA